MKKYAIIEIESCNECPYLLHEGNYPHSPTNIICIGGMGERELTSEEGEMLCGEEFIIMPWCPLSDTPPFYTGLIN